METQCTANECIYLCLLNIKVYLVLKLETLRKKEQQTNKKHYRRLSIGGGVKDVMHKFARNFLYSPGSFSIMEYWDRGI